MKTLLAFILLCYGFTTIAQTGKKPKGKGEIRFIGNVANIQESEAGTSNTYSSLVRQGIGLLGHAPINKNFWISPGIFYNWVGASTSAGDLHLNYLNVPVFFKYVPTDNGVVELYAGPQFGLLLKAVATNGQPFGGTGDASRFFKNTDIDAVGGVAVVPPKTPLVIMAQYTLGISDIADHNVVPASNSFKNRIFSFGLGYRF